MSGPKLLRLLPCLALVASSGAAWSPHPLAGPVLLSPDGLPLVVHEAVADLPLPGGSRICQDCEACGVSRHWAAFNMNGDWEPRSPHTARGHECADPIGIDNCPSSHTQCGDGFHEDEGFSALVADLVLSGPTRLAEMVAAKPEVIRTADGMALQLRSPCDEDEIAVYLPLAPIAD